MGLAAAGKSSLTIARNAEAPPLPVGPTPVTTAWAPLRHTMFRALWIASLTSNVGTWMQSVAAVWLMTSLSHSPILVALVQTAASLPLVFLALPAGALADMVDRRKLLLLSQTWMMVTSAALGVLTVQGLLHDPWLLLGLTFAMGIGTALTAPAWLAITLELVPRSELAAAVALSSASLNLARAVGPAVGGLIVAAMGAGPAFLLNAASFLAVLWVLFLWRREPVAMTLPREHVFGAIRAGLRFVRHSPALKRILLRVGLFVFFTSSIWALLPVLARHQLDTEAAGYGVLLGCIGIGAVIGAFTLPRLRDALSADRIVDLAGVVFGIALILLGLVPNFGLVAVILVACGLAWMSPLSCLNVETQSVAPAWVRARALALHLLVLQGGLAGGAALWGWVADRLGSPTTLQIAGAGLLAAVVVSLRFRLRPTAHIDLSPSVEWPAKEIIEAAGYDDGPVLVSVEYRIDPAREDDFLATMEIVRRMRRRSGAWRWGIFRDAASPDVYLESFLVESWLDHLRQHERMTVTDRDISSRAQAFHTAKEAPVVRHLIAKLPIG
jgi:MFS family permease